MPVQSRFSAPSDDNFAAVDRKIGDWLAAQSGVQSTKTDAGHDFGALDTRFKVIANRLDNNVGDEPAKFLNDPRNTDVKKAVLDYFKPPSQNPTTSVQFMATMDDIISHDGPQANVAPAPGAASATVISQYEPTVSARHVGGYDSRAGSFGSDVELTSKGRLAAEVFQPTQQANSQLLQNPAPTVAPAVMPGALSVSTSSPSRGIAPA